MCYIYLRLLFAQPFLDACNSIFVISPNHNTIIYVIILRCDIITLVCLMVIHVFICLLCQFFLNTYLIFSPCVFYNLD